MSILPYAPIFLTHTPVFHYSTGMFKKGNALFNYLEKGCEAWPSVMTQWKDNMCRGPLIGAQIVVPMRPLEEGGGGGGGGVIGVRWEGEWVRWVVGLGGGDW